METSIGMLRRNRHSVPSTVTRLSRSNGGAPGWARTSPAAGSKYVPSPAWVNSPGDRAAHSRIQRNTTPIGSTYVAIWLFTADSTSLHVSRTLYADAISRLTMPEAAKCSRPVERPADGQPVRQGQTRCRQLGKAHV